jgi:hypothetical protein
MKNVFLSAIMVAVSFMATAQTLDNPLSYDDFDYSNKYEWFKLSDRPHEVISYGDHDMIDIYLTTLFNKIQIDLNSPGFIHIDELGNEYRIWEYMNKKNEYVKLSVLKDEDYTYIIFADKDV